MNTTDASVTTLRKPHYKVEDLESSVVYTLTSMGLIHPTFTGSVTLHFNQGGLTDYDRLEKSLKKKLNR
jgi:hypothetical protein